MYSHAENVTQATFKTFIARKQFALLRLSSSFSSAIDQQIVDYLEAEYPGLIAFGSLERRSIQPAIWWTKHFGPILSALKMDDVKDGYYLFHRGEAVTWHSGSRKIDPEASGAELFTLALGIALAPGTWSRSASQKNTDALLNHLDPVIQHLVSA